MALPFERAEATWGSASSSRAACRKQSLNAVISSLGGALVIGQQTTGVNAFLGYAATLFKQCGIENPILFNSIFNSVAWLHHMNSFHIIPYHSMSFHIISYHFISFHIISHISIPRSWSLAVSLAYCWWTQSMVDVDASSSLHLDSMPFQLLTPSPPHLSWDKTHGELCTVRSLCLKCTRAAISCVKPSLKMTDLASNPHAERRANVAYCRYGGGLHIYICRE